MPTPAAKKPTKKALPAAEVQPAEDVVKKPRKAAAPKPESTAKPKKAPAKKVAASVVEATPLPMALEAEPAPAPAAKPARGRKPASKAAQAEPAQESPTVETPPAAPHIAPPKAAAGFPPQADTVLTALREGRPLEFIFLDSDANPPRTFEPRQLVFDTLAQAWFVWGWDRRYNAERHHRLDALAEVNQVEGMGRSAQGPYAEGTPANLLGGWLGGEPIPVKVSLMKQWIFAVKQAPPAFPEFRITDAEDGKATVTFTATDLRAIARWCMQFGDGIQVLEPQRLVDRLKQAGIAWAGKAAVAALPAPAPVSPKAGHRHEEPKREPRREERHREERHETRREREGFGGDSHKGPRREESKPAKAGPKVEVRVERL